MRIKAIYPPNWKEFSRSIRIDRAKNRCECCGLCGLHQTHPGPRRCTEMNGQSATWANGKVVLTTAHICDCDPPCAIPEHVLAMCNRCHLRIDVQLHINHRRRNIKLGLEQSGQMRLVEVRSDDTR